MGQRTTRVRNAFKPCYHFFFTVVCNDGNISILKKPSHSILCSYQRAIYSVFRVKLCVPSSLSRPQLPCFNVWKTARATYPTVTPVGFIFHHFFIFHSLKFIRAIFCSQQRCRPSWFHAASKLQEQTRRR
jgi:hypothetical protein